MAVQKEKNLADQKEVINQNLSSLNKQLNALHKLKNTWNSIEDTLFALNEKLKSIDAEIVSLNSERSKIVFFAGKRKKEINDRICTLEFEQQETTQKIALTQ